MSNTVFLRMMGEFVVQIDGREIPPLVTRTRKGVALLEYLILNHGKYVPKQRLMNILWSGFQHTNPESALKTLISRLRKMLNDEYDGLGDCIMSERGGYRWECLPNMRVDMLEIMQIYEMLPTEEDEGKRCDLYEKLMRLYKGDLFLTGDIDQGASYEAALHSEYLNAVYDYIEILINREAYNKIIEVCKKALSIDEFDDRLHMEMMQAQVYANRLDDAMEQYRRVTDMTQKYLDTDPSEEMQSFYQKMIRSGKSLRYNLETVKTELKDVSPGKGAYVCNYDMLKQIFHVMSPVLDRLGCTMFLGLIMLHDPGEENSGKSTANDAQMEKLMKGLLEILRINLRRGDIVVRYAPTVVCVLLPTVNHTTGNMVMERIRHLFFEQYPNVDIPFHYRLGELGNTGGLYLN